jgi:hypothetical protein
MSKNCNYLSLGIHKGIKDFEAIGEALALKREHTTLRNMKFLNFFLFRWVMFALLDPEPEPDPKHCF